MDRAASRDAGRFLGRSIAGSLCGVGGVALALTLALGLGAGSALAETAVGVKAGTTGLGLELSTSLSPRVVLRGGVAAFERSQTFDTDIEYDGDLELLQGNLLLDLHPTGGAFRITAGAVWNDNALTGEATVAQVAEDVFGIDPALLAPFDLGVVRAEVTTDSFGPYLGFGWGDSLGGAGSKVRFSFDVGVIYHGEPTAEATVDSRILDEFPELRPAVDAFLEEEVRQLEEDAEDYTYYPVVSLGLSYRF